MQGALRLAVFGKPHITYLDRALRADHISAKGQALLVYLAVTGRFHSRTALAGLLWGGMPEETARANLRLTLSKLRKFLPGDPLHANRLEIGLTDFWLDATEFARRIEIGDSSDHLSPISDLQSFISLYRGDFLEDFHLPNAPDFDEWVMGQREQWRQTAVTGLSNWLETAVQENNPITGIPLARKLLSIDPWHEETHRQLMRLLAASGQRSAALAQYETCRRLLADELGIEPAAETTSLYTAIRDEQVATISSAPNSVTQTPLHNLPPQLTPFIDREAELDRLVERLQQPAYRLLTLLGEGGAGKTRLALAAADRVKADFADGVWFVSLVVLEEETAACSTDPPALENSIATAIATAMNLIFVNAEPPKAQIIHFLRSKTCLLLLDNFEPILNAAGFVLELLTAAPGVTILATSREPLHLQAEAIVRVEGLALPETAVDPHALTADGIRLFAERAERTTGKEIVTAVTLPDVLSLCQFVNGLPLGIELIAGWTRWLNLPAIRQGLAENVVRLETQMPDVAPRHRSLQAVFDYSWQRLSPAEQTLLAQCAVFRRGFQLEAMQQVTEAIPTTLFALIDKSLVQIGSDGYYRLHELLRQYAMAQLAASTIEQTALYSRHATYYLDAAEQQADALLGPQPHHALRRLQADSENLAQAWQWAVERPLPEALALGVTGMSNFWHYAGLYSEGEQAMTAAIAVIEPLINAQFPQPDLCRLLARLTAERASLLFDLNRLDEMEREAQTSLRWAEQVGDGALAAHGHLYQGQVYWRRSEFEAAAGQFQEAQALAAASQQTVLEAIIWRSLAATAWRLGDLALAEANCRRSLQLHQQIGDIRGENRSRHFLSILALNRQAYVAATNYLQPIIASAREIGDRRLEASACAELGQVAGHQGQYETALAYFARERELAEEMGVVWQLASNAGNSGDVLLHLGEYNAAQAQYEQGLALFRQAGSVQGESNILAFMGLLACLEGRFDDGRSLCQNALKLAQQADARREQAFAHLFLAHNLAGLGRWREARDAYAQAQVAWQVLDDRSRLLEAQAGAAWAALRLGDVAEAVTAVNSILSYLQKHTTDGADDPMRIYLVCYEVLQWTGDERAVSVLADGHAFLQARASRIQNLTYRQMFLHNNPTHREIYQGVTIPRRTAPAATTNQ